jgi:hypothetical protein
MEIIYRVIGWNSSPMSQIALVANKLDDSVGIGMIAQSF